MINKLEERRKKKEKKYKLLVLLGVLIMSTLLVLILMYSKVSTEMEYPIDYYVIGEGEVFNDSQLLLEDIRYEPIKASVSGDKEDLLKVDDVSVEVDLFKIKEILDLKEKEDKVIESETENVENVENVDTEGIEGSEETGNDNGEGNESGNNLTVEESLLQGVEFLEDGYILITLPVVVEGYESMLNLEPSIKNIEVMLKVTEKEVEVEGSDSNNVDSEGETENETEEESSKDETESSEESDKETDKE